MFGEILIGLLISAILLYLLYLYLGWCSTYSSAKILYKLNPSVVNSNDKQVIATYGKYMLPEYLSDTYRFIRFWILYYTAVLTA
jgi:hypothetical protein